MGILFGILITILVIDAVVGIIAAIVHVNTWGDVSAGIAGACLIAFVILMFAMLLLAFATCDTKVGTGR